MVTVPDLLALHLARYRMSSGIRRLRYLGGATVLLLGILAGLQGVAYVQLKKLSQENQLLTQQHTQDAQQWHRHQKIRKRITQLKKTHALLMPVNSAQQIRMITQALPKRTLLHTISYDLKAGLMLTGFAATPCELALFMNEMSPLFPQSTLITSETLGEGVLFEIRCPRSFTQKIKST